MMRRGFSSYLDILRFGAAFVVLLSHFAYPRFSEGRYLWLRELNLGSDAVVLFFVLSGVVIAFSAQHKDATLRAFAFNRLTRVISVALPALVLGYLLDRLGATLFPNFYASAFYNPISLMEQLARGLTFTNEWAGHATRLGSNGPFWSLSYEVGYYALFAVSWYLGGAIRAVLLLLVALLLGPNILLLMPSWLLGVWVWRCIETGNLPSQAGALLMVGFAPLAYMLALWLDVPETLSSSTFAIFGQSGFYALRFSDEFIWNGLLGICMALHLLGVATLVADDTTRPQPSAFSWLAGGSFSLYLVHYPLLQFLAPALPNVAPMLDDFALLGLTILLCYIFAQVFERSLKAQREFILGLKQKRPRQSDEAFQTVSRLEP